MVNDAVFLRDALLRCTDHSLSFGVSHCRGRRGRRERAENPTYTFRLPVPMRYYVASTWTGEGVSSHSKIRIEQLLCSETRRRSWYRRDAAVTLLTTPRNSESPIPLAALVDRVREEDKRHQDGEHTAQVVCGARDRRFQSDEI